jgi:hypothetical protein
MLGRRPSGGGWGLSINVRFQSSTSFKPPRQQPLAAGCSSLSNEGNHEDAERAQIIVTVSALLGCAREDCSLFKLSYRSKALCGVSF